MKRRLLMMLFAAFVMTACNVQDDPPAVDNANANAGGNGNTNGTGRPPNNASTDPINIGNCGGAATTDLIAGQTIKVGEVDVSVSGNTLTVTYRITEADWMIGHTHLEIEPTWHTMPLTPSKNPKVGLFEYNTAHDPMVLTYTYPNIDVSGLDEVAIAAHAEVYRFAPGAVAKIGFVEDGEEFTMNASVQGGPTYIRDVLTDVNGNSVTFDAWCIDQGAPLGNSLSVVARDPATVGADLNCLGVDNPQNFDNALYVVNRDWSFMLASWREIQYAIWLLVEASPNNSVGANPAISQQIVNLALQYGDNFVPGECDYRMWVIDTKCDPRVQGQNVQGPQSTLIFLKECPEGEETAWGYGPTFPGQNWAMYFNYCINP